MAGHRGAARHEVRPDGGGQRRAVGYWPGFGSPCLYQGRDLAPTLALRAVLKGVLAQHPEVSPRALEREVFPDTSGARPLKGLPGGA